MSPSGVPHRHPYPALVGNRTRHPAAARRRRRPPSPSLSPTKAALTPTTQPPCIGPCHPFPTGSPRHRGAASCPGPCLRHAKHTPSNHAAPADRPMPPFLTRPRHPGLLPGRRAASGRRQAAGGSSQAAGGRCPLHGGRVVSRELEAPPSAAVMISAALYGTQRIAARACQSRRRGILLALGYRNVRALQPGCRDVL